MLTFARICKVGCIETTMALKAPDILNYFQDRYPDVDLEFRSEMRNSLISEVMNYNLDAAFISAPINSKAISQIKVKEEQLVILTSSNSPKLEEMLANQPINIVVFGEGCIFRTRIESWLSSKGIIHYKSTVLNSIEGIVNFVESGIGISILPEEVVSNYYSGRKISTYGLNKEVGTMNTVLIYRNNESPSRALKAFIDMYL
ncbi:LysR substrate-binding domain-containing protein [Flavobacterium psychroterrae]|nr:LysR substrate-binding domain-containing protein [Flavobacterium psychroterrae]